MTASPRFNFAVALALGRLIGLERERTKGRAPECCETPTAPRLRSVDLRSVLAVDVCRDDPGDDDGEHCHQQGVKIGDDAEDEPLDEPRGCDAHSQQQPTTPVDHAWPRYTIGASRCSESVLGGHCTE